jgi:hypothetical protein
MKNKVFIVVLSIICTSFYSQELFLRNEPASNVPKGVLGVRLYGDNYSEQGSQKNMFGVRLMYGLLPKLSVMANIITSNHHNKILPRDLINHVHDGANTSYFIKDQTRGLSYDYSKPSINLYAKYRFLTNDGEHKHFRMAAYAEYSFAKTAHDEAEPNLMDDTKGFGAGLLTTYLKNKFAISLTSGFILPQAYKESVTEEFDINNTFRPDFMLNTKVVYGKALQYNLSMGYLLFPRNYENYNQANFNLYIEFIGKAYDAAKVYQNGEQLAINAKGLKAGNYIEMHPGVQFIYKSNLRIDAGVGFNLINKSYARSYPMYMLAIQRYFYL